MERISEIDRQIETAERELAELDKRRAAILEQIKALRHQKNRVISQASPGYSPVNDGTFVTNNSSEKDKILLFQALFRGREDVYPRRFESKKTGKPGYQPACRNEWLRGVCGKPRISCGNCENRKFIPVTDDVIRNHLLGYDPAEKTMRDFTIGVYPLLPDETTWFIAADFDQSAWMEDVSQFLETCKQFDIPAAVERSRSGNGGHVWVFFSEPVPAGLARKMFSFILTETMERHPEIGLRSYDRLFPNQDTIPKGGFGNLIALPLQKKVREKGNSLFLNDRFEQHPDQWAFLSSIRHMGLDEVKGIVDEAMRRGRVLGVRMAVTDEQDDEPWTLPPSRRRKQPPITGPLPEAIELVLDNQVYVAKEGLPAPLKNRLIRLAAFQNPEFYKAQAMRISIYGKDRIICCCEDFSDHIGLPRGCLDDVIALLKYHKIKPDIIEERFPGHPIDVQFQGILRPEQQAAADAMLSHDTGVLSATTGFGKTVIAAYMIAERKANTLVLVHRKQLLNQWIAHLNNFLNLSKSQIGQIGGGKRNPTGVIDIAMIQSLWRKNVADDIVGEYGNLIVDECHHVSAWSFENVVRQSKAKYVTGLSATVTRKDGHHPIIFMQCGPVQFRVDDRKQAQARPFIHKTIVRRTDFTLPKSLQDDKRPPIHMIYSALMNDERRNTMIITDVLQAISEKRSPVILTERRQHLAYLADQLSSKIRNVIVLKGGMGSKQVRSLIERLANIPDDEERIILATGRYLGEGFDDARLDTLFLTLPISWRGTLTQYAGRLHRLHYMKKEVLVYDYVDFEVPVLTRMFEKRCRGYKAIGYEIEET